MTDNRDHGDETRDFGQNSDTRAIAEGRLSALNAPHTPVRCSICQSPWHDSEGHGKAHETRGEILNEIADRDGIVWPQSKLPVFGSAYLVHRLAAERDVALDEVIQLRASEAVSQRRAQEWEAKYAEDVAALNKRIDELSANTMMCPVGCGVPVSLHAGHHIEAGHDRERNYEAENASLRAELDALRKPVEPTHTPNWAARWKDFA